MPTTIQEIYTQVIRTLSPTERLRLATVREIYGVAKAHNITGGIAITSSKYSPAAKKFTELKPDEIAVYDRSDILRWIETYRWNDDEKP